MIQSFLNQAVADRLVVALMVSAAAAIGERCIERQGQAPQPVVPDGVPLPEHAVHGVVPKDEQSRLKMGAHQDGGHQQPPRQAAHRQG